MTGKAGRSTEDRGHHGSRLPGRAPGPVVGLWWMQQALQVCRGGNSPYRATPASVRSCTCLDLSLGGAPWQPEGRVLLAVAEPVFHPARASEAGLPATACLSSFVLEESLL